MQEFVSLLTRYGYASVAAEKVAEQTVAPEGADDMLVEQYLNAIVGNYYMQYLALKLQEYGFDLNRPDLPAQELNRADSLIEGKMGNPPLDNLYVVEFLQSLVVALRKKHKESPLTWGDVFAFSLRTRDGEMFFAKELVKALIRSDRVYTGTTAIHYRHSFLGVSFRTVSMKELMAYVLPDVPHEELQNVNRYGYQVQDATVDHVRYVIRAIRHLTPPNFREFFSVSTHRRVMLCVKELEARIHEAPVDSASMMDLYLRLKDERYARGVYSDNWQRFIGELESALEMVVTPYQIMKRANDAGAPQATGEDFLNEHSAL